MILKTVKEKWSMAFSSKKSEPTKWDYAHMDVALRYAELSRQPALFPPILGCQPLTRQGCIGGNDPTDPYFTRDICDIGDFIRGQIRGNFQENRNRRAEARVCCKDAIQESTQGVLAL